MAQRGIILDNAGTGGALVLRGPSSGVSTMVFPDTNNAEGLLGLSFNSATGNLELVAQTFVPTYVSEFTNDSGYQTSGQVDTAVNAAIQAVVGAAPAALDTLKEIADQLASDQSAAGVLTAAVAAKADSASLSAVAFSGSYADLTNKPTIPNVPTLVSAFTNDAGYAQTSSLAAVATSGSYTDLSNKPSIPTVPTAVSAFTNDSGYQTSANVAAALVPYATASSLSNYVTMSAMVDYASVESLATVATTGQYGDLLGRPTIPTVPTVVSAFTNDSGYQTAANVATAVAGKADAAGLADVATTGSYTDLLNTPAIPTVPTVVSAFTNDSGYQTAANVNSAIAAVVGAAPAALDTLKEIADQLAADESAVASITTSLSGKADASSLATVATSGSYADLLNKPTIPTVPTNVSAFTNDSGYQTAANVATAIVGKADTASLSAVATSGSYNDLLNKPSIPTVPTAVSAFTNDSGYQTAANVAASIAGKADTSALAAYATTASLATVATTGAYADLSGKPTIPTVPTAVSAFTNDAGYLTTGTLAVATTSAVGVVKVGAGLAVAGDGTLSATGAVLLSNGNGTSTAVATVATTDATVTVALSANVAAGQVMLFEADVIGKTSGGALVAGFTLSGVVKNVAGTVTISGGGALKEIIANEGGWDADVSTNASGLEIQVTGASATSITWVISAAVTSIA